MSCITSPRVSNLNLIVRGRFFSNDYENTFHIYFVIGLTILDGCTFLNTNSRFKSQRLHREENGRMTCLHKRRKEENVSAPTHVYLVPKRLIIHVARICGFQPSSSSHASTLHFCPLVLTFFSLSKLPPFFSNLHHSSISFYH